MKHTRNSSEAYFRTAVKGAFSGTVSLQDFVQNGEIITKRKQENFERFRTETIESYVEDNENSKTLTL